MADFLRLNPWISVAGLSWIIAQALKLLIEGVTSRRIDIGRFIETGGMPSSHTALMCGLSTSIGLTEGWHSLTFAISSMVSLIVIYDATHLRRDAGHQAELLNDLIHELRQGEILHPRLAFPRLRELLGHTPFEVSIGAIVGVGVAFFLDAALGFS